MTSTWIAVEGLKLCYVFVNSIAFNVSIVYFYGWRGYEGVGGHKIGRFLWTL